MAYYDVNLDFPDGKQGVVRLKVDPAGRSIPYLLSSMVTNIFGEGTRFRDYNSLDMSDFDKHSRETLFSWNLTSPNPKAGDSYHNLTDRKLEKAIEDGFPTHDMIPPNMKGKKGGTRESWYKTVGTGRANDPKRKVLVIRGEGKDPIAPVPIFDEKDYGTHQTGIGKYTQGGNVTDAKGFADWQSSINKEANFSIGTGVRQIGFSPALGEVRRQSGVEQQIAGQMGDIGAGAGVFAEGLEPGAPTGPVDPMGPDYGTAGMIPGVEGLGAQIRPPIDEGLKPGDPGYMGKSSSQYS